MPPSNLTGAPPSMDHISALINLQTLTNITGDTQINELRSFSTALSEFISRYDELNNHISFINSSIDSKLPPHHLVEGIINPNYLGLLETSCDTTVTQGIVSVQNPSSSENTKFSSNSEEIDVSNNPLEIDALEKPEAAADLSNNRLEIDVLKEPKGADVFEVPIEINTLKSPEVADVSNNSEEIEVCENNVDIDSLEKLEVADIPVEIDTRGRDIDVFKNRVEIDSLNSVFLHDYDELDVLKKLEVAGVSKDHVEIDEFDNRVEMGSLKKPEDVDVWMNPEEIEVCEDPVEIDIPKEPKVVNDSLEIDTREEIDVAKNFEVDVCENHVEIDSLNMQEETVPESSCDETMADAPGAVVSEQNLNIMAANGKQSNENVRRPECVVEIDVLVHKKHEQADVLKKPEHIDICKNPNEFDTLMIPEEIVVSKKLEETIPETCCDRTIAIVSEQNPNELDLGKPESLKEVRKMRKRYRKRRREFILFSKNPVIFKLQSKCRNMSTKQLKRHVATHYSEMINLREEIANALKLAEDPAKLVLRSIGSFFVTSSERIRMHAGGSHPLTVERMALVLILECFVMISSDGIDIAKQDREYAAETAVGWKKRMINEGGLGHTDEVDARGLLLLISGFGIQDDVFTVQDILDLIRVSNVKEISAALCRSVFLIPKIPEVIYLMVKNNLEIEAVDIANTFGLENVCHPRNILTTDLHNKIKDIQNALPLQMNNENVITPESLEEVDILKKPEETAALKKPEEIDTLKKIESLEDVDILKKPEEIDMLMIPVENDTWKKTKEMGVVSGLQFLCQRMDTKRLKWHIKDHISEMNNLRVDIANALKLAEDPAKLAIYSIGRFFERSCKSFQPHAGSRLNKENVGRLAAVLILECFLMISDAGIEITKKVRKYAVEAATVWRKRIIKEGGLRHTDDVDARGLLLLISGFRIQDHVFSIQDFIDLIRASNVKGITSALRRSVFLMPKIREIICTMVHNNLEIEAVDIAYTFGLEDTYHPGKILMAYLDNKIKDIQNASPDHMLDAVKQHLFDLKSVKQCLESHNVDPSTLLPDFKINERIQNLEKEVNEWKLIHKRRSKENPIHQEAKRACVSHQNMPHQPRPVGHYRSPQPITSYITA
ncbi:uncharacterized protein LOC143531215, partial [Bidens hawaiensis]|uniref:uncharacterized protein LOC143531215 n=1 Tax=Bidens hawaiensis TaxID=980011 RepID=UPI00404A7EEC